MTILRATPSGLMSLGEVAQGAWAGAVAVGFVAAEPGTSEWRLTRKGRSHLKRLLSRCGEPVATTTASCAAASGPGTTTVARARPDVNPAESPLAWLSRRKDKGGAAMIGEAEFQAGERLRADSSSNANLPRLARLAEGWEKIARAARDTADYNLERKPFVFSVFSQLAEATR